MVLWPEKSISWAIMNLFDQQHARGRFRLGIDGRLDIVIVIRIGRTSISIWLGRRCHLYIIPAGSVRLRVFCFFFFLAGRFFRVSNIKTEMLTEQDRHLACVCHNKTSYRVYSLFLLRWISFVLTTQTTILLYPVLIPTPPTPPNVVSGLHSHRGKGRKCNWNI